MACRRLSGRIAKFDIPWEITREQFDAILTTKITKDIITSYENVPLRWRVELEAAGCNDGYINFNIIYVDGILPGLEFDYGLWKRKWDDTYLPLVWCIKVGSDSGFKRGEIYTGKIRMDHIIFDGMNSTFQVSFQISDVFRISKFRFKFPKYVYRHGRCHSLDFVPKMKYKDGLVIFSQFDNFTDPDKIKYPDATLVSADDTKFYCHRIILAVQSDGFDALFRNPLTDEAKKGIFELPTVAGDVLEVVLRYLYKGTVDLSALNVPFVSVVELADFAEQYGLKELKETCIAYLWKNIGTDRGEIVNFIRFSDLHDDMKYLKDRAFDYLAENFEALSQSGNIFNGPTDQDSRLRTELHSFMSQRVTACLD